MLFLLIIRASFAQEVRVIRYDDLKKMQSIQNDTTYIFNFWATWCKPCVKELPYFDALSKNFEGQKVKVILVSLDFKSQLESRLKPFVKENKINSTVLLLNEPDYNSWIDQIDKTWQGSIPATLIINTHNGIRKFFEQEFTEAELHRTLKKLIY